MRHTTIPERLHAEATRRGLTLALRGDRLGVSPAERLDPEFREALLAHKGELLDWLEARQAGLAPDCAPWLPVARQVLAGEFDGADRSTSESLAIGLRNIPHPACRRALERLKVARAGNTPPPIQPDL